MNAWLLLLLCIGMEIAATSLLKLSNGFSRPLYGYASLALYSVMFWIMAIVLQRIPAGITYAVWSGVGIVGIAVVGWLVFDQRLSGSQIGFISLVLIGAIGLNLTGVQTSVDEENETAHVVEE